MSRLQVEDIHWRADAIQEINQRGRIVAVHRIVEHEGLHRTDRLRPAVFLDLNGTLVKPVVVDRLADLKLITGAERQVARLCREGFVCPVVTVQSRIEKGVFSEADFSEWFAGLRETMRAAGAVLVGPYVCPHRFATPCLCAKPQTLLYEQAAAAYRLDLSASFAIGDTMADMEAVHRFGGRGCFVRTGFRATDAEITRATQLAACTGEDLKEVVDWILRQELAN